MTLLDRPASLALGAARTLGRAGRYGASWIAGQATAVTRGHPGAKPDMDDVTLARKVETELFRPADAPKGKVDVNAADGVVELRGEVKTPAEKADLESRARAIPEVRDVHNHLHLPKTPAPTRADSPGRARRRTTESTPRTAGGRTTAERPVQDAEPTPAELARSREARPSSPLGSEDESQSD